MSKIIKKYIKKNNNIYFLLSLFLMLLKSKWINFNIKSNLYPTVLQFPITNKCNSKCVMCNVTSCVLKHEMNIKEFEKIINDAIFSNIKSVGINGGEPFLSDNLIPFIQMIVKKPKVKFLNIISNGFLTDEILSKTKLIYKICKKNNVNFHLSFSLDGYNVIHDKVRGIPGAFLKTNNTICEILSNKDSYCDSCDIACTVVKQNINYLVELETFAEKMNWKIKFRLGVQNIRLNNLKNYNEYSILDDESMKQTAKEFFYSQIIKTKNIYEQYKYWAIFSYLNGDKKRKLGCLWKNKGITLDGEGNIYYCAVQSPCIGNLKITDGEKIFFEKNNVRSREKIISEKCNDCIHDYDGQLLLADVIEFIKWKLFNKFWIKQYR